MKNVLSLTSALILASLLLPLTSHAQENDGAPPPALTIAPSIIELEVKPGEKYEEVLYVTNGTSSPLPVTTDFKDYTMDEEGMPVYFEDTSGWSPRDWITVEPPDFILRDNERHEIILDVNVPEKAKSGSHIAALFFQPVLPEDYFEAESAHIIPYIGAVIALNVRNGEEEKRTDYLEIQEFAPVQEEDSDVLSFSTKLFNDDVYFHRVGGSIEIYNIFDDNVHSELVGDITLLPEKLRSIEKELSEKLSFGKYRAELVLGESGSNTKTRIAEFWIPPTLAQMAIMIGIFALVIGVTVFVTRAGVRFLKKQVRPPKKERKRKQKPGTIK